MVESLTVVTLGSPSAARSAIAAALAGRRAAADATLVIAAVDDEDRLLGELRQARRARPGDRLVVIVETVERGTGRRLQSGADAVIRLHPCSAGSAAAAALAARRVERALSAAGILAPPVPPSRRFVRAWLTAVLARRFGGGRGGVAAG